MQAMALKSMCSHLAELLRQMSRTSRDARRSYTSMTLGGTLRRPPAAQQAPPPPQKHDYDAIPTTALLRHDGTGGMFKKTTAQQQQQEQANRIGAGLPLHPPIAWTSDGSDQLLKRRPRRRPCLSGRRVHQTQKSAAEVLGEAPTSSIAQHRSAGPGRSLGNPADVMRAFLFPGARAQLVLSGVHSATISISPWKPETHRKMVVAEKISSSASPAA